jgi:hypothetical protein
VVSTIGIKPKDINMMEGVGAISLIIQPLVAFTSNSFRWAMEVGSLGGEQHRLFTQR